MRHIAWLQASCRCERTHLAHGKALLELLWPHRCTHKAPMESTGVHQLHTSPSMQHPDANVESEALMQQQHATAPIQSQSASPVAVDSTIASHSRRRRGTWQQLAGITINNRRLITKGELMQQAAQLKRQNSWHVDQGSSQQPTHSYLRGMLNQHTHSLPSITGQAVQARVLMVKGDRAYVDAGFHSISELYRPALSTNHIVQPAPSAPLHTRTGTSDIRVGDVVAVKVEEIYTPYGDMQLQPLQQDPSLQLRARWAALREQYQLGKPVQGRVLNQCRGGYAVGVAGFVGLLPYHRAASRTCQNIGALQPFYIEHMDDMRQRMVLVDAEMAPKGPRRRPAAASPTS